MLALFAGTAPTLYLHLEVEEMFAKVDDDDDAAVALVDSGAPPPISIQETAHKRRLNVSIVAGFGANILGIPNDSKTISGFFSSRVWGNLLLNGLSY